MAWTVLISKEPSNYILNWEVQLCLSISKLSDLQTLGLISIKGILLSYRPNRRAVCKSEVLSHFQDPKLSEVLFPTLAVSDRPLMQKNHHKPASNYLIVVFFFLSVKTFFHCHFIHPVTEATNVSEFSILMIW